jgi:predicted transposase/invertase (TIGR01784 family)
MQQRSMHYASRSSVRALKLIPGLSLTRIFRYADRWKDLPVSSCNRASPFAVMPLGINPLNDFAFMKTFGTPENRESLVGLLNAVLKPKSPIADVTIQNPFNYKDFEDDKLSILDVKAVDAARAWYDVEVQLRAPWGLEKRLVYYGCELYTGQLGEGADYAELLPAYSVWLLDGVLWAETPHFHHAFRLTDAASGRVLDGTLAIHTVELPKYNLKYSDLIPDDLLGWWLYWLRHAPDYEPAALRAAFPHAAMRRASETLIRIAEISEDKAMYDARERAIRDRKWEINAARREGLEEGEIKGKIEGKIEGKLEGKIEAVRMLQGLLYLPVSDEKELSAMGLEQLDALTDGLQEKLRSRTLT